uniref:septin-1-like isoform X1 n=2 Tax=Semicossyphus pulcher TaxID=241346 RepID=UPI0037E721D9
MALNTSYAYITSKHLIRSGSPAVYQLTPKKENIGTLTRMTLGKKDPKKTNRTILLVGETGTGKSTLINALVNYALGVTWEDDVWFEIVEEGKKRSQCESQTSDVIVYEIFGFEDKTLPYSLTIIDTPGYGDTRGTDHDYIISKRLLDLFRSEEGVHEINAVGLVLKASDNRLSDRMRYIFDSVVSLFGKNMENNIVSLITHSDGRTPENALEALNAANIKCAKDEKNRPVHFLFNNCQNKDRTEAKRALKYADETTAEGMKQFTDFLGNKTPKKLETTADVLNERITLKACIQNLQERIVWIELKQKEIPLIQETLKKHEDEMRSNKNFTVEFVEVYKDKEPINGGGVQSGGRGEFEGAICCTVCEENCHYPCTKVSKPGSCKVMRRGRCVVCSNKCPVSDHVKEQWRYVSKTRKVQNTLQDMKRKYERSKADCEKTSSLLETLQKEMEKHQQQKDRWLDESFQHVLKLEQIALNANSLSTHIHLDFLIEKMRERGDAEKVQKLEEIKQREDGGTRAGLRYMLGRLAGAAGIMRR